MKIQINNRIYSHHTYKGVVQLINDNSLMGYEPKLKDFRKGVSIRHQIITGRKIKTLTNKLFIKDLVKENIITILD